MKNCSIADCKNKFHAKGFCKIHYNKLRLYGNPLYITNPELKSKRISQKLKGKPKSEEHKQNLSKATMGRPSPTKGMPKSDEQKKKQSEKMKGRPSPRKGTKHTEESKKLMSLARLGKKDSPETKLKKSIAHNRPESLELARRRGLEVQARFGQKEKTSKSLKATYSRPEMREMQRQRRYKQEAVTESRNEKIVQGFLKSKNIPYVSHKTIHLPSPKKYHQPDILIEPNKIIEVYGDYFHANPTIYNDDFRILFRYEKVMASDIRQEDQIINKSLKKLGFDVLILWENEFGGRRKPKMTEIIENKILDFLKIK